MIARLEILFGKMVSLIFQFRFFHFENFRVFEKRKRQAWETSKKLLLGEFYCVIFSSNVTVTSIQVCWVPFIKL